MPRIRKTTYLEYLKKNNLSLALERAYLDDAMEIQSMAAHRQINRGASLEELLDQGVHEALLSRARFALERHRDDTDIRWTDYFSLKSFVQTPTERVLAPFAYTFRFGNNQIRRTIASNMYHEHGKILGDALTIFRDRYADTYEPGNDHNGIVGAISELSAIAIMNAIDPANAGAQISPGEKDYFAASDARYWYRRQNQGFHSTSVQISSYNKAVSNSFKGIKLVMRNVLMAESDPFFGAELIFMDTNDRLGTPGKDNLKRRIGLVAEQLDDRLSLNSQTIVSGVV